MNVNQPGNRRLGKWMIFAAWLLGLAMLYGYFTYFLDTEQNPNQSVYSRISESGLPEVVLKRNRYGHYISNGKINGQDVVFMLDTGATDVAIPDAVADRLKLERGARKRYQTANGVVEAYSTKLENVAIGPLLVHNVRASINPGLGGKQVLLGMSVLKHVEFTQSGDTLVLRPLNPENN